VIALLPGAWAQAILFEHATIIDATGAPPIADISVAVANGRISVKG